MVSCFAVGQRCRDIASEVHLTDRNLLEKSGRNIASSSLPKMMVAGDHTLQHIGITQLHFEVENGKFVEGTCEVSEIVKTIVSVDQLVDEEYQVIFSEISRIVCPKGDSLPLTKIGGPYRLPVVRKKQSSCAIAFPIVAESGPISVN